MDGYARSTQEGELYSSASSAGVGRRRRLPRREMVADPVTKSQHIDDADKPPPRNPIRAARETSPVPASDTLADAMYPSEVYAAAPDETDKVGARGSPPTNTRNQAPKPKQAASRIARRVSSNDGSPTSFASSANPAGGRGTGARRQLSSNVPSEGNRQQRPPVPREKGRFRYLFRCLGLFRYLSVFILTSPELTSQ